MPPELQSSIDLSSEQIHSSRSNRDSSQNTSRNASRLNSARNDPGVEPALQTPVVATVASSRGQEKDEAWLARIESKILSLSAQQAKDAVQLKSPLLVLKPTQQPLRSGRK